MGYYMSQVEAVFSIPADKVDAAHKAVQALSGKETIEDSSGRHFRWVHNNFAASPDLQRIMMEWRWKLRFDLSGNAAEIYFNGEKAGDDEILFDAIAPFVKDGSYIEMRGEDGECWRWVFDSGKCTVVKKSGVITADQLELQELVELLTIADAVAVKTHFSTAPNRDIEVYAVPSKVWQDIREHLKPLQELLGIK